MTSFSLRVVKFCNRLPICAVNAHSGVVVAASPWQPRQPSPEGTNANDQTAAQPQQLEPQARPFFATGRRPACCRPTSSSQINFLSVLLPQSVLHRSQRTDPTTTNGSAIFRSTLGATPFFLPLNELVTPAPPQSLRLPVRHTVGHCPNTVVRRQQLFGELFPPLCILNTDPGSVLASN